MANGKIIKPGEVFSALPSQIPEGFRDVVVPVDDLPEEVVMTPKVAEIEYTLKSRGQGGWYDVVDSNGKIVNDKALKLTDANQLISDLS